MGSDVSAFRKQCCRVFSWQVIEQYFFEHEPFDHHRHIIITTVVLFASMIRESDISTVAINVHLSNSVSLITCDLGVMLEITGGSSIIYASPAIPYSDNHHPRCICHRSCLHISGALLYKIEQRHAVESKE